MTRELIIEGQHVDLAPDTDITLEYVSNIIGDIGKINLSRSYTVKIPKTARNARVLDDPGRPGHESGQTRRFLSARFYRNGIDLIGPAQAYILKTTPDAYEIALVWNTLETLQALSQSGATLNDLPGLPILQWIEQNGMTPDYTGGGTDGAFFAFYNSGLGGVKYPAINTATHPSMGLRELIDRILESAGIPYEISAEAAQAVAGHAILAAPKHEPSRIMEMESGSSKLTGVYYDGVIQDGGALIYDPDYGEGEWQNGWDAVEGNTTSGVVFFKGENDTHRIMLNLQAPQGADFSNAQLIVRAATYTEGGAVDAYEDILSFYFRSLNGVYYVAADEEIKLSGWQNYYLLITGDAPREMIEFTAYDKALPIVAANRVHKSIDIAKDNRFPLQGNLPDIKQWDLIKATMAMFGLVPIIQNGALYLLTYNEALNTGEAYDWTAKVDMSNGDDMAYALDGWAQRNTVAFQEDFPLSFSPNADLIVQDTTLEGQRDVFELPFAASMQSEAQHYKIKDDGTAEDVDIAPRIFKVVVGSQGQTLYFTDDMHSQGLIEAHYTRLQEVIRKPVAITVDIRLHEIDLATLDLSRPVYLGQYGRYYAILKIQTSNTDLCKVELLQLP